MAHIFAFGTKIHNCIRQSTPSFVDRMTTSVLLWFWMCSCWGCINYKVIELARLHNKCNIGNLQQNQSNMKFLVADGDRVSWKLGFELKFFALMTFHPQFFGSLTLYPRITKTNHRASGTPITSRWQKSMKNKWLEFHVQLLSTASPWEWINFAPSHMYSTVGMSCNIHNLRNHSYF